MASSAAIGNNGRYLYLMILSMASRNITLQAASISSAAARSRSKRRAAGVARELAALSCVALSNHEHGWRGGLNNCGGSGFLLWRISGGIAGASVLIAAA